MFLLVSVILYTGGVLSQHALQVVSQHALQQVSGGGCLLPVEGGVCSQGRGCLLPGGECLLPGGVSAPGGCLLLGGVCSQGVSALGGVSAPCGVSALGVAFWPGPHPRGKLRGIRSRPTPKGEIEGDQIQAHTQGGN